MISILLAGIFFVGIHLLIAGTGVRDRLVGRLGEQGYLALFSLLSLGGISWLCAAWARSEAVAPGYDWLPLKPLAWVVMFFAFQFVVIGLTTKSPTATGGEGVLGSEEPATGILRVTRHPFLWGVALWGLTHLIVNPDLPALLFFGALTLLALLGPASIDAKRARKHGDDWQRFADKTSNLPFAAILAGRNRLALGELGWWKVAAAALLYGVFLVWLHPLFFAGSAI